MDIELRILIALAVVLVLASIYINNFTGILVIVLLFGFIKIVLMNPRYEWLRDKVESLF